MLLVRGMKLVDITGQTFGRLKVIRKSQESCMWECECSCGNSVLALGANLRKGSTGSCGCLHKELLATYNKKNKANDLWVTDMQLYIRKTSYRRNKVTKGLGTNQFIELDPSVPHDKHPSLEWGLTLEQYVNLVTSDCHYCGTKPHQKPQGKQMPTNLFRNGIDRADNNRGYLPDNCVPCCTACNREKRAATVDQFIENTKRRYEHLVKTGRITTSDCSPVSLISSKE